jgi:predicted Zn-ribbon and HTH transcriptional regulator
MRWWWPFPGTGILPAMGKGTTETGYRDRNWQVMVRLTHLDGADHNQYVYVMRCWDCGYEHGANGSDVFQRRCPNCQSGAPGMLSK